GMGICESGFYWLRFDLSPLGYLKTAAHGHFDALHLSIWFKGVAMVIDPGTGAYYADEKLRMWLASRAAPNGPCLAGEKAPKRLGPFLWGAPHSLPTWKIGQGIEGPSGKDRPWAGLVGELSLPGGILRRCISRVEQGDGWRVDDSYESQEEGDEFTVRWQFA